jgi:hypothetical protein
MSRGRGPSPRRPPAERKAKAREARASTRRALGTRWFGTSTVVGAARHLQTATSIIAFESDASPPDPLAHLPRAI